MNLLRATCIVLLVSQCMAMNVYHKGDAVKLLSNKIGPYFNPDQTYRFSDFHLFCQSKVSEEHVKDQYFGEDLEGDSKSEFVGISLGYIENKPRTPLCQVTLTPEDYAQVVVMTKEKWYYEFVLDDLPMNGFVGKYGTDDGDVFLTTHYHINVFANLEEGSIIFANLSYSTTNEIVKLSRDVASNPPVINFTYSVDWFLVNIQHKERSKFHHIFFFPVLKNDIAVHWYSIMNSLLVIFFLLCALFVIFTRIIKSDSTHAELDEEPVWRQLVGELFRIPPRSDLLGAMVGVGLQLSCLSVFFHILAFIGVYYTGNDGAMIVSAIVLYALTSVVGGFTSLYWHKKWHGTQWVRQTGLTALLFALPFGLTFALMHFLSVAYGVTKALSLASIVGVLGLWILLGLPLQFFGGVYGKRIAPQAKTPTRMAAMASPVLPFYYRTPFCMLLCGVLSFSVIFVEVNYINNALWVRGAYRMFGISGIVAFLLFIVTCCSCIIITYIRFSLEECKWWWTSFLSGGSVGGYLLLYSVYYYVFETQMFGFLQTAYFFGFQLIVAYFLFLMMGSVGFLASYIFVNRAYQTNHID